MAHEWFTGHNRWPNCLQPRGLSFESLPVSLSLHTSGIFYLKLVADTLKKSAVAMLEGIICLRNFLKSVSRWWSVTSEKKKKYGIQNFFFNWATDLKLKVFLSFENKGMLWRMENIQKEYSHRWYIKNLVLALDFHIPKNKNKNQLSSSLGFKSVFIREACLQSEVI